MAILLVSGGVDSITLLYHKISTCDLVITFDYGSRQFEQEIKMVKYHTKKLGVKSKVIELPFFSDFTGTLVSGEKVMKGLSKHSMSSVIVPFRNGIFLSIAVGLAESLDIKQVMYASIVGDEVYRDALPEFVDSFNHAVKIGTKDVRVLSPFKNKTKADVIKIGNKYGIDWTKTYSCYEGSELHCGVCTACTYRKLIFGEKDVTRYLK